MEFPVVHISDIKDFKCVKTLLDPYKYIECGICGAVKVDALNFLEALDKTHNDYFESELDQEHNEDEYLVIYDRSENAWHMIDEITELEPDFESFDNVDLWVKWKDENFHRYCTFIEPTTEGEKYYSLYSEILVVPNLTCDCFHNIRLDNHLSFNQE